MNINMPGLNDEDYPKAAAYSFKLSESERLKRAFRIIEDMERENLELEREIERLNKLIDERNQIIEELSDIKPVLGSMSDRLERAMRVIEDSDEYIEELEIKILELEKGESGS